MTVQVDFDASWTPSSGDFLGQLGKNLGQLGKSLRAMVAALQRVFLRHRAELMWREQPSKRREADSSPYSPCSRWASPRLILLTWSLQTIGFVLGPAIQSAVTPLGCSQEYLEGHLRWERYHRRITPPPAWTCIMYHPSLDMYTLTGWIGVAAGFLSLILFMPGVFQVLISIQITQHSEEWEDPLKSSYRSFQCQKERGSCPMEMKAKQEWLPALQILSTLLISSCVNVMNSS